MKNKKKTVILRLCAVAGVILVIGVTRYKRLPEFRIRNAFSQSYTMVGGQRCRDTDINVVVYKNRNDEELYKRIEYEHNRINGEPTKLEINLYNSESEIINGKKPYKIISIDYINNIIIIE